MCRSRNRQRELTELLDGRGKGHRSGAALEDSSFSCVEDLARAGQKIALKLLEIGEQPLFSVCGVALIIGIFTQNSAIAHDLLPLLHLQRAKSGKLWPPYVFVAGAGRIAEAVAKAQVLADEND